MLSETFGERIARLRERVRSRTQAKLAELAGEGITESWIAAVERDRIENPLREKSRIRAIAKVLGVTTRYLTEPLGIVFVDDEEPGDDEWERVLLSDDRFTEEAKQSILYLGRAALVEKEQAEKARERPAPTKERRRQAS